jgi:hypothetical protein
MESTYHPSRKYTFRIIVVATFLVCSLLMLVDVATTAVGLSMGGHESDVISAAIIRYYGLAGFELVKLPGVVILLGAAVFVCLKWNRMHAIGRYAFATVACFGLLLTAAPVANNQLEIFARF